MGIVFVILSGLLLLIDFLINKFFKNDKHHKAAQISFSIGYLFLIFWLFLNWQSHNEIIFPNNFKSEAGIVFGIEGYPKLPEKGFWKRTIHIPNNGVIITSTKVKDISSKIVFKYDNDSPVNINKLHWNPNFEYPCFVSDKALKTWIFTFDNQHHSHIQDTLAQLSEQVYLGKKNTTFTSGRKIIWEDNKGKYLWLSGRNLRTLPEIIKELDVYKVILTENNFSEIPLVITKMQGLEDLTIANNPIEDIRPEIVNLKNLKSLSIGRTNIKDVKTDLSALTSLDDISLSENYLEQLPEQIKNLPNLRKLYLDGNKFKDFSFMDSKLEKLQTLYLQSNQMLKFSSEVRFLKNLKELLIFDNQITSIPDDIEHLKNLEKLEIWDNPIHSISPNIKKLVKLKSIRIDDNYLTLQDKEDLQRWLPQCEINFQTRTVLK